MSDLDNEEIKATKMLNLIDEIKECAKNTTREDIIEVVEKLGIEKGKSADEMFKELGYKAKIINTKQKIYEYSDNYCVIEIWYDKTICKKSRYNDTFDYITMQELKAISKKCKELGWL